MPAVTPPRSPTLGISHPPPDEGLKQPPPDQALAEHPVDYSDPELAAYTDEVAQDILDDVVEVMPIVIPLLAVAHVLMFGFIAVLLG